MDESPGRPCSPPTCTITRLPTSHGLIASSFRELAHWHTAFAARSLPPMGSRSTALAHCKINSTSSSFVGSHTVLAEELLASESLKKDSSSACLDGDRPIMVLWMSMLRPSRKSRRPSRRGSSREFTEFASLLDCSITSRTDTFSLWMDSAGRTLRVCRKKLWKTEGQRFSRGFSAVRQPPCLGSSEHSMPSRCKMNLDTCLTME
mmetsp:Transcript_7400/g.18679  ORF Transcript_7400/g.18679 Transcript_7400/m.18679 type:complete len:205 (+) Transcript_7400:598-1212(+)